MNATEACFSNILSFWPDPVVIVDKAGALVCFSPAAHEILAWSDKDCLGNVAHERLCVNARGHSHSLEHCPFNAPDQHTQWQSVFWCSGQGDYLSVDVRATALSGDCAGYVAWSLLDNRERIHNHAEFEKFAQFVELSPGPMVEFDAQGQILFANAAMQDLMVSVGFNAAGQSEALPENIETLCGLCLAGANNDGPSAEGLGLDSPVVALGERFIKWHFLALNPSGPAAEPAVIAFAFDVTHQQRAREELEEAKRIARRDFYAKMIHELRTPLNAIMGFSDLLLARSKAKLSDREYKNLQAISNAGFQLNELVTDTLDISKIEAGFMGLDIDEFDVGKLCQSFLPQIESLAAVKNLTFNVDLNGVPPLKSDSRKVRQILINLLSNAIKYTREGSVTLTLSALKDAIQLSVADTGVGIPEAQKHKLFNQYSQIDEAQNAGITGTGLGLALVGELVKMLQGEIIVHSEYNSGSEFVVILPLQYIAPNA